jgi:predicted nucleic acid-binding protein
VNFLDSTIFINWFKATKRDLVKPEVSGSGFVLYRIEHGEAALTSSLVKDEVALWLSRYKRSRLPDFLDAIKAYTSLTIECPTLDDELEAESRLGGYALGYLDCVNLAIMTRAHIDTIYSSDRGFDGVPGVRRLLEDLTKDPKFVSFQKWARENL